MEKFSNNYSGMNPQEEKALRRKKQAYRFDGQIVSPASASAESFAITLNNLGEQSKRIVLFPGDLENVAEVAAVAGFTADAIAAHGTILLDADDDPQVTCVCENLSYAQRFLARNPTRIMEIQFSADNKAQFDNPITMTKISPVESLGSKRIRPSQFQKPGDSNITLVSVPFDGMQLDDQSVLDIVVGAGRSITLTFFFGASRNDAKTLAQITSLL